MVWGCSLGSPAVREGRHQVLRKLLLSAAGLAVTWGRVLVVGREAENCSLCET